MYENSPKIICKYLVTIESTSLTLIIPVNEEYLDLRKCPENNKISSKKSLAETIASRRRNSASIRKSALRADGLRYEKELINCGLKKLVTSYNATASMYERKNSPAPKRKISLRENSMCDPRFRRLVVPEEKVCLKSQSELSMLPRKLNVEPNCPSTPVFQSKKTSNIEIGEELSRVEPTKNKCTMTKNVEDCESKALSPRVTHQRSKSRDFYRYMSANSPVESTLVATPLQQLNKPTDRYVDCRLQEKYSVLKMPWRRTWTIPVFSPKSTSTYNKHGGDNFDRQTYLYDDGTEIDSSYMEGQNKQFSNAIQNQCVTLFLIGGSVCGILLVSLLIWLVFGHNLLHYLFTPRETDHSMKAHIKYVAGGIINLVTTFFHVIGTVLTIPTHQVYQTQHDNFRWLTNNRGE
ncbi:uncharacterized protein isoform X2 [Leptinotarsa decemlineata]|uniref:uncharacterized protein isoform X2 n=1 Tax=Leptinotarsa decemlineata TaxID=7539 RepID=UPI003D305E65